MTTRTGANRQKGRDELRKYFEVGQKPTSDNFSDLIDSMVNIVDDRIDARLRLTSMPEGDATIEFKQRAIDLNPAWKVTLNKENCLLIKNGQDDTTTFVLHPNNKIEMGAGNDVIVHGELYANNLSGNAQGTAAYEADGRWHEVLKGDNGAKAYEITAICEIEKKNGFIMARAIAIQHNNRPMRLKVKDRSWFFFSLNRILFKWEKTNDGCVLKLRTLRNYGKFTKIRTTVKKLC